MTFRWNRILGGAGCPMALALALLLAACDASTTSHSQDIPDALQPDALDDPGPVHAVTSATPTLASSLLTDRHAGFRRADCASCHEVTHGGSGPADCVTCHGANGAPVRPNGHADSRCTQCHPSAHAAQAPAFAHPVDCRSCHRFAPGAECPSTQTFDVVVVGAGGGGLGAATTLALAGRKVALVERHNKVGGYMTNFNRGDFRFEISLHAMGGFDEASPGTRLMFQELGILDRLTPVKADFMYRTFYPDDVVFDTPDGFETYRDHLISWFPDEAEGITRLFRDVRASSLTLAKYMEGDEVFNAYMQSNPDDVGRFVKWAYGTLGDALREYVSDPHLFAILAQLASYVGVEPDNLSALYFFLMWNGYHLGGFYNFIGGSQSISDALAAVIEEHGGTLMLNTAATSFDVADGRVVAVRTDGGACLRADWFVSNVNLPGTLDLIGRQNLPASYVQRIDAMRPGWPLVVVYLGTNRDFTPEFEGTHELLIQDSWDTNEVFESIDACAPEKSILLVANYSVVDATAAPPGKNVITITGTVGDSCDGDWQWANRGAYKDYKDAVGRVFIDRVERILPGLSDAIEVIEVAAPQTLRAFTGNPRGTIYGWHQTPEQSLLDRPGREVPGLENLVLAGAWTFPGCGQSAVIQSGKMTAEWILDQAPARR